MYAVGDIQRLHIEVSSLCNARCPSCVRNIHGANANTGYTERNLSLADVKKIFSDQPFLTQLKDILFCGNFGDLLMNPETPDIVAWFRDRSPGVRITAGTNGGGGTKEFWSSLGSQNNAIQYPLQQCIQWFDNIVSTWKHATVAQGALSVCQTSCGKLCK